MPIKLKSVFHVYNRKTPFECRALSDINLEIKEGSFTAIVGHTGSGKSTLVQHLNGLLIPTSGEVDIRGFRIIPKSKIKNVKELRKEVGVVFQFPEYQLFEETVLKDVMFGPRNFGFSVDEAKARADSALRQVGIREDYFARSPFELSGGEKRRVAIAGIIALEPKILVLDEPTAGLDPQGAKEMMDLFRKIHKNGTTIILVTHDMDLVLGHAEEVIVMENGKVAEQTTPTRLFSGADYQKYALDTPWVFACAKKLLAKGLKIDIAGIHDIGSLANEIVKARKKP